MFAWSHVVQVNAGLQAEVHKLQQLLSEAERRAAAAEGPGTSQQEEARKQYLELEKRFSCMQNHRDRLICELNDCDRILHIPRLSLVGSLLCCTLWLCCLFLYTHVVPLSGSMLCLPRAHSSCA